MKPLTRAAPSEQILYVPKANLTRHNVTAYVGLGANLGDARETVLLAFDALAQLPTTQLIQRSKLYRTAPHEAQGPDFFNAVARIDTCLTACDLLDALQAIERQAGRLRPYFHAPRTLDLDLLFYGDAQVFSPRLTLPIMPAFNNIRSYFNRYAGNRNARFRAITARITAITTKMP